MRVSWLVAMVAVQLVVALALRWRPALWSKIAVFPLGRSEPVRLPTPPKRPGQDDYRTPVVSPEPRAISLPTGVIRKVGGLSTPGYDVQVLSETSVLFRARHALVSARKNAGAGAMVVDLIRADDRHALLLFRHAPRPLSMTLLLLWLGIAVVSWADLSLSSGLLPILVLWDLQRGHSFFAELKSTAERDIKELWLSASD